MAHIRITNLNAPSAHREAESEFPFLTLGATGGRGPLRGAAARAILRGDFTAAVALVEALVSESIEERTGDPDEPISHSDALAETYRHIRSTWPDLGVEIA